MKQTARILSTYSADTFGVCSALYELGGMVVIHDPSGCNSTYTTHDEPRWFKEPSQIFVSALTENQLTAAVATVGILLVFLLIGQLNQFINVRWIRFIFSCVSVWSRFQNFTQGVFDLAALFYYLSVAAVFLFLTIRVYDRRRYN